MSRRLRTELVMKGEKPPDIKLSLRCGPSLLWPPFSYHAVVIGFVGEFVRILACAYTRATKCRKD